MGKTVGRCGYVCSDCLAYKDNIKREGDEQRFCDALLKYYGDKLSPDEVHCDGCLKDDSENPKRIDMDCAVRRCVIEKGCGNCSRCNQCPCDKLQPKIIDGKAVADRFQGTIPADDYEKFVRPYEIAKNRDVIDASRTSNNEKESD